jgi:hypothetical protein
MWHSMPFFFPVRKEFLQLLDGMKGLEGGADEAHSLTTIAVAGRKTIVRSHRLFSAEKSHLVSRAICRCMRLYTTGRHIKTLAPAVLTTAIASE